MTHKGAAADSGHYIGFVKKSVHHAAKAKSGANRSHNSGSTVAALEEIYNTYPHLFDTPEVISEETARSLANALLVTRPFDPEAVPPSQLEQGDNSQGDEPARQPTDPVSAPIPGPSTSSALDDKALELEDDEDWYKFDDEKVTDFPKEKLPTLEGGGEDSSAYVLVYRTKAL